MNVFPKGAAVVGAGVVVGGDVVVGTEVVVGGEVVVGAGVVIRGAVVVRAGVVVGADVVAAGDAIGAAAVEGATVETRGQDSNSQSGPTRPTTEPSGQTLASFEHATGLEDLPRQPAETNKKTTNKNKTHALKKITTQKSWIDKEYIFYTKNQ